MPYNEVVLLLFGNFNPISNMHLRMFEIAKDHLIDIGYSVHEGVVSPFEKSLISIDHRVAMIKYALSSSDWVHLSPFYCEKFNIPSLLNLLQHHQARSNFICQNSFDKNESKDINQVKRCRVVKLLCGADILLFLKNSDSVNEVQQILMNHGVVVISRAGFDIENIIYENEMFWTHRKNILIIKDQVENQISSKKIRTAVSRNRSIKYLVNDAVERYISLHNLYTIEYKNSVYNDKLTNSLPSYEVFDSFQEITWGCHSKYDLSSETLTSTSSKKSKLFKNKGTRTKKDAYFRNVDKSKLIEIPLTQDGIIQIIADKETNL